MPSTIISVLASALFAAATAASPIAEAAKLTPQINAGHVIQTVAGNCDGRILNIFSFTSNNCINNDTSATSFFNNQKIVAREGTTSRCLRVNTPGYQAGSFVYTADGFDGSCTLESYQTDNCRDEYTRSFSVDADVSGCYDNTSFKAVKLVCPDNQ